MHRPLHCPGTALRVADSRRTKGRFVRVSYRMLLLEKVGCFGSQGRGWSRPRFKVGSYLLQRAPPSSRRLAPFLCPFLSPFPSPCPSFPCFCHSRQASLFLQRRWHRGVCGATTAVKQCGEIKRGIRRIVSFSYTPRQITLLPTLPPRFDILSESGASERGRGLLSEEWQVQYVLVFKGCHDDESWKILACSWRSDTVLELVKPRCRIRVGLKSHVLFLQLVCCADFSSLYRAQDIFRRLTNPTLKKLYRFVLKRLVGRFLEDDIALEVRNSKANEDRWRCSKQGRSEFLSFGGSANAERFPRVSRL